MNVTENSKSKNTEKLLEEAEFNRLVSFSKGLSEASTMGGTTIGDTRISRGLPQIFGSYELTRLLKSNSVGNTFAAKHVDSNGEFLVTKIRESHVASVGFGQIAKQLEQLRRESMAANAVFADNLSTIFEVGEINGEFFYSASRIRGKNLGKLVNANMISNREAATTTKEVAESIHQLHQAGVFHRDLKSENIVLDSNSMPHILPNDSVLLDDDEQQKNSIGFLAPEVTTRESIDTAAEIWSMGAILYNCLVGEPPMASKAIKPPRKFNSKVARDLETICMKCLSPRPAKRYPDARELARDLDRFLEYQPIEAAPAGILAKLVRRISRMG